jgi:hypothetical protein
LFVGVTLLTAAFAYYNYDPDLGGTAQILSNVGTSIGNATTNSVNGA